MYKHIKTLTDTAS